MFLMSRTGFVRRSPGTSIDQRLRTCPSGPWCGPAGRSVPGRSSWVGGREGSLGPRALRGGKQRRRAPGGALSDPDWRHPEQRRTDLVGAEEPPAYARCRLTAEDFGHRNGPPLIPRMQGKRKDLADLWSRGTGEGRRPALGPHGIAHAIRLGGCMPRGRSAAVAARRRLTSVALTRRPDCGGRS